MLQITISGKKKYGEKHVKDKNIKCKKFDLILYFALITKLFSSCVNYASKNTIN